MSAGSPQHATTFLARFTPRLRRSIMAAADLHLLAARLDRPISPTGHAVSELSGLTRHSSHPSRVSRRIRDLTLAGFYQSLLRDQLIHDLPNNYWVIDSKGLAVPWHSTDRFATLGPCDGRYSRGYRLHLLIDRYEQVWSARVTPLNVAEQPTALDMLNDLAAFRPQEPRGLLLTDRGYDSIKIFDAARSLGLTMLCHRRVTQCSEPTPADSVARYRSFLILEKFPRSHGTIAMQFVKLRDTAERAFAHLCGRGGGLTGLPPWVRTSARVRTWVLAKLVLHAARQRERLLARRPEGVPADTSAACEGIASHGSV